MHPLTPPFFINYHLLLHPTTCITSTIPSNRTPHHSFVVIVIVSVAMEAVLRLVETPPYYEPPAQHSDSSRPTLGFPLGTALLLIVIFSLSGFFSCCYHWDKLRHLRGASDPDSDDSPSKLNPTFVEKSKTENQSLPVLMPGDRIAKFIALPCPCEPPRRQKIELVEEAQMPPKPPHIVVPMY